MLSIGVVPKYNCDKYLLGGGRQLWNAIESYAESEVGDTDVHACSMIDDQKNIMRGYTQVETCCRQRMCDKKNS